MKRIIPILLAVMLCAVLFVACTEPEAPTVNMTEYYAKGRTKFHELRNVWLPEIEGLGSENNAESLAQVDTWTDTGITFDIIGGITEERCNTLLSFLKSTYGEAEDDDDDPLIYDYNWTVDGHWYQMMYEIDSYIFLNSV